MPGRASLSDLQDPCLQSLSLLAVSNQALQGVKGNLALRPLKVLHNQSHALWVISLSDRALESGVLTNRVSCTGPGTPRTPRTPHSGSATSADGSLAQRPGGTSPAAPVNSSHGQQNGDPGSLDFSRLKVSDLTSKMGS